MVHERVVDLEARIKNGIIDRQKRTEEKVDKIISRQLTFNVTFIGGLLAVIAGLLVLVVGP